MQILGNILLGLASVIYLVPLQLLLAAARRAGRDDGGAVWGGVFVFLPLWLVLTAALSVAAARGGLDWIPVRRAGLHGLIVGGGLALFATSIFGFLGRLEPVEQLPVVSRPFLAWADLVLPLATMALLLFALNPSIGAGLPPLIHRLPFAVLVGASLIHGVALLGEWSVRAQRRDMARAQEQENFHARVERERIERLSTLDPVKNFSELLGEAASPDARIHTVALEKLRQHPRFLEAMAEELGTWRAPAVLEYLAAHDIPAEKKDVLAEPVLGALNEFARKTAQEVDGKSGFDPFGFARRARLILAVADRFPGQRREFSGIIREFRRAIETASAVPLPQGLAAGIDRWISANDSAPSRP